MLPLDDSRWESLGHRGTTFESARFVPDELKKLLSMPTDLERFDNLWPYLCSEGTTWASAYAAAPYIVSLAGSLDGQKRIKHLYVLGLSIRCSCPGDGESFEIKPYLEDSYRAAIKDALPLLAESLKCELTADDTQLLLVAAAALKGNVKLAEIIDNPVAECPKCNHDFELLE